MEVKFVTNNRGDEWNALTAREHSFSLTQSWEWGEFKAMLGWKVFRIAVEDQGRLIAGAQMLVKMLPAGLASVAYVPRGPIGNWMDPEITPRIFAELHRIARSCRAVFMKIEPPVVNDPAVDQIFQQYRFKQSLFTNQPRATIVIDIDSDLNEITRQMRKRTREYIKSSSRNGVTVRRGGLDDIPAFYNLMRVTAKRGHFSSRSLEYYQQEWQAFSRCNQTVLLLAYAQDQLLAGHMAFSFGGQAAYFHGGSINNCGHLRPNYLLVWEAVKWAKEQGCQTFDLWGVPDEVGKTVAEGKEPPVSDRTDGLWGVYRFKSGFGKNIIYYLGAYDYVYNPLLYALTINRHYNPATVDKFYTLMDNFIHH